MNTVESEDSAAKVRVNGVCFLDVKADSATNLSSESRRNGVNMSNIMLVITNMDIMALLRILVAEYHVK
jgi:tryptophan synthase alpha subunit